MTTGAKRALIVRSVDYKDNHKILTLLTEEKGRVSCIAYNARRSRKRFGGALQPFQLIEVELELRRGRDLEELVEAQIVESYEQIPRDTASYACASYVLELARELTPEGEGGARVITLLQTFLRALDREGARAATLAPILYQVLASVGFWPALDRCALCGREAPWEKPAFFELSRGVVCTACGGQGELISGAARKALVREGATAPERELAVAAKLLCGFAHEKVEKRLKSWVFLKPYLERATMNGKGETG